MLLAIFIFLIIILILAMNIHLCIKSKDDALLIYLFIGKLQYRIPRLQINLNKPIKMNRSISLIKKIASHSIIDRVYIAKYSIENNEFSQAIFLIMANQFLGILHNGFRIVNNDRITIIHDQYYENIDYYLEAHISVINLMCALIKG